MKEAYDIIGGILIVFSVLSILFFWAMYIRKGEKQNRHQDVHVWRESFNDSLPDALLKLRDQGYYIKLVIQSRYMGKQGVHRPEVIIITEKS
jgi:hypothetical protein